MKFVVGIKILRNLLHGVKSFLQRREATIVDSDNVRFVFFCSTKRLRFVDGINKNTVSFSHLTCTIQDTTGSIRSTPEKVFIRSLPTKNSCNLVLGTTIHDYSYSSIEQIVRLGIPVQIFIDGFYPSNYPRSYIDSYGYGDFVVNDMFAEKWFRCFGRKTIKPYRFLQKEEFKHCNPVGRVKTVVLLLNHAGDWTALINRSDTDKLVETFARLAKDFNGLNFVIRSHPTMAHSEHEGIYSLERLKRYVESCGLHNLSISNASLEEDLSRGELYLSEYSRTLLDCFRVGRLGLIVNLTRRRSFMIDYQRLGFLYSDSYDDLCDKVSGIQSSFQSFVYIQNDAVDRYNSLLQSWLSQNDPVQC